MFYTITWQHYLLYVAIALALWYGAVLWLYYRGEARRLMEKLNKKAGPNEAVPDDDWPEGGLLGRPAEEFGVSLAGSEEINFRQKPFPSEETHHAAFTDNSRGLVPDVLQEIKAIVRTIETEQGTKEDFSGLFKLVSSKYPDVKTSYQFAALNEWISENIPFELTEDELSQLWN